LWRVYEGKNVVDNSGTACYNGYIKERERKKKMAENNKIYAVIDEYDVFLEDRTFDNYDAAEVYAKSQAEQNPGLEIFIVECKRVARVFVPNNPAPIVEKL
jgi:hypothetical protein